MNIERTNSGTFVVNRLPDGSRLIADSTNETAFALNAVTGAAWDACANSTTLADVTARLRSSFDPAISDELAREAILQLQDNKLVRTSESLPQADRRRFIATLAAAAVPVVVSLTFADQRAHAVHAASVSVKPCAAAIPCPKK